MGFGRIGPNSRFHQALTLHLFGVRSQPRYLKVSTPRAWSIARVKSRVARFYARFFLCWSNRDFDIFEFGHVHRPNMFLYCLQTALILVFRSGSQPKWTCIRAKVCFWPAQSHVPSREREKHIFYWEHTNCASLKNPAKSTWTTKPGAKN